jgi:hypothetical protein
MSTPTSALTFENLLIEVARKIGVAYYGVNGDEAAQVPTGAYDLSECKRLVNNGIRMYLNDGPPPNGWRFARPVAEIVIWGDIGVGTTTVTGGAFSVTTTLSASADTFYETMEGKTITITGIGDFVVKSYTSATVIEVIGDASTASGDTFSIASNGDFTLPAIFGGETTGEISYKENTNQGVTLTWQNESLIRKWRENVEDSTGDPYWASVRPMLDGLFDGERRRWELSVYPEPDEVSTVLFPFILSFDKLVAVTEHPPVPVGHDEALKAACLAVAEKDVEGAPGVDWGYYKNEALPQAYQVDFRSAPKSIGYVGNPSSPTGSLIKWFRGQIYTRPTVDTSGINS